MYGFSKQRQVDALRMQDKHKQPRRRKTNISGPTLEALGFSPDKNLTEDSCILLHRLVHARLDLRSLPKACNLGSVLFGLPL